LRRALIIAAALIVVSRLPILKAQDLPLARQYLSVAPEVLASAVQVPAAPVQDASGSVLVIFRRGTTGRIIDANATGGNTEMQSSALTSIRRWQFKPVLFNGVPAEMVNAAVFAFRNGTVTVGPAPTMTASQLTPTLGFPCPNAYAHHDVSSVQLCKQQLHDVQQAQASSDVELLIAHDEYGLALLSSHQLKPALVEFSEAVRLATQALNSADPEVGYIYLHRASAETGLGDSSAAEQDLARAKASLDAAVKDSSGSAQTYYQRLEQQLATHNSNISVTP
jgi:hypothetical protein